MKRKLSVCIAVILTLQVSAQRQDTYQQARLKTVEEQHRLVKTYFSAASFEKLFDRAAQKAGVSAADRNAFHAMISEKYFSADKQVILGKINRNEFNDINVKAFIDGKVNEYASYYEAAFLQGKTSLIEKEKVKSLSNKEMESFLSTRLGTQVAMSAACGNVDFEQGSFGGWFNANYNISAALNCGAGTPNPMPNPGFNFTAYNTTLDEHGLCTAGFDPAIPTLPTVSPFGGGTYSCRLGDVNDGCGAAQMSFSFAVTAANINFTYDYTAILYDGHIAADAPKIIVTMTDLSNNQPIGCAAYSIDATQASQAGSGYVASSIAGLYYKPWSQVFVPLSAYIGKNVQVNLLTTDCDGGAHRGYAYFDFHCSPFYFTYTPPVSCQNPNGIINAPGGAASYTWTTLGSGTIVGPTNTQSITVSASGDYQVTMTAFGSGCSYTIDTTIVLPTFPRPIAAFNSTSACAGSPIQFTDQSSSNGGAPINSWSWNFGDGQTSTAQNPTNIYATGGTYTATLIVSNGCKDTIQNVVTVLPTPTVTVANMGPYCPGDAVPAPTFTNNPNDPNTTYVWTNTNGAIGLNGNGAGIPPSFTCAANNTLANMTGVVTVTPTLNGCVGPPANYTITVKPTPFVNYIPDVEYCPGVNTAQINFSVIPGGGVPTYTWVNTNTAIGVGLASTGTTNNISSFQTVNTGTAVASADIHVVPNLNGCVGPDSVFKISINPNPTPSFFVNSVCAGTGLPTKFTDESYVQGGTIVAWAWDFNNDGLFIDANSPTPQTILTPAGTHSIGLAVTSNKGCKNQVYEPVYINYPPTPAFTADKFVGCPILPVNFTESSTAVPPSQLIGWNWDFGNGQTSINQNPTTVNYNNSSYWVPVKYNVTLQVTTDSGCVASITKPNYIEVYPRPKAGFTYTPPDADLFDPTIYFFNTSIGGSGSNPINYYLGDIYLNYSDPLNWSNLNNPIHKYSDQEANTYYITQWVKNVYGCRDSITEPVTINPIFTFYIPNAFSPNGDGKNEGFKGMGIGIDNTTYNLWIFDRWGNQCFYSNDIDKTWDGRVRHQGDIVLEDVYVWKVKFHDIQGLKHEYHGTVSVVK